MENAIHTFHTYAELIHHWFRISPPGPQTQDFHPDSTRSTFLGAVHLWSQSLWSHRWWATRQFGGLHLGDTKLQSPGAVGFWKLDFGFWQQKYPDVLTKCTVPSRMAGKSTMNEWMYFLFENSQVQCLHSAISPWTRLDIVFFNWIFFEPAKHSFRFTALKTGRFWLFSFLVIPSFPDRPATSLDVYFCLIF